MGRDGLYYRQTLSAPTVRPATSVRAGASAPDSQTHGPMIPIESEPSEMVDSSFAELLDEIEIRRKRFVVWPIIPVLMCIAAALLILNHASPWIMGAILGCMAIGTIILYQHDQVRKTVALMYDIEGVYFDAYEQLHHALNEINRCGAAWRIAARSKVYNTKYHAGAGQLVDRFPFSLKYRNPPYLRTNLSAPAMSFNRLTFYLLPDLILVHGPQGYSAVDYASLVFEFRHVDFVEESTMPRDAHVIDHTWRFVNKDGGPDRRFNNNPRIPVCRYEQLRISNSSGVDEQLQFSRPGVSAALRAAVSELVLGIRGAIARAEMLEQKRLERQKLLESGAVALAAKERRQRPVPPPVPQSMHSSLFDLLCCVMLADGRASSTEVTMINQIMGKIRPGWTEDHGQARVDSFVTETRKQGFAAVLERSLSALLVFKSQGRERTLIRCIELVANADGVRSERENQVLSKIRNALMATQPVE